jgi:alanine racemase
LPTGSPAIALRARVVSVRTVRQGEGVSYSAAWTAPRDSTVATLGIGYADGVRRLLGRGSEATVLLNGARCPVVGRVTMDLMMVDVRDGRAAAGDVATLVGEADGLVNTLDQFAAWSDTLPHELLAGLGPRLPRIYR